jgi:RNA polymerase sigma factor (sigma-70 family)
LPRHIGVSTQCAEKRSTSDRSDPAELVALVAQARRALLLRAHRHRLRHEDLEDCFSQATVELVGQARAGGEWTSAGHLAGYLERRFLSRINDRLRAIRGRSLGQAVLEGALAMGYANVAHDLADARGGVEELAMLRMELRRLPLLARALTPDQRLVLVCQVALQMSCGEFCETYGWSREKYRKVAQRSRARLRRLSEEGAREMEAHL